MHAASLMPHKGATMDWTLLTLLVAIVATLYLLYLANRGPR